MDAGALLEVLRVDVRPGLEVCVAGKRGSPTRHRTQLTLTVRFERNSSLEPIGSVWVGEARPQGTLAVPTDDVTLRRRTDLDCRRRIDLDRLYGSEGVDVTVRNLLGIGGARVCGVLEDVLDLPPGELRAQRLEQPADARRKGARGTRATEYVHFVRAEIVWVQPRAVGIHGGSDPRGGPNVDLASPVEDVGPVSVDGAHADDPVQLAGRLNLPIIVAGAIVAR